MSNIYDFGGQLSKIGDSFVEGQDRARQRAVMDTIGSTRDAQGNIDYAKATQVALQLGDIKTATALAGIHNQNLQRGLEERKLALEPYQPDPNKPGGVRYTPGGSADPNVRADQATAAREPPRLSPTDIDKLDKTASQFSNLTGFVKDFKDEFAGYTIPGSGAVATWLGRSAPEGYAPGSTREAATFWQGYNRFKNVVRNELFGSALTPGESKAFAEADIDPSMNPQQIKINLARQHELAQLGMKRKAEALIESGYKPEVIARVFGVPLAELGITVAPQRQFGTPPPPAATSTPPPRTTTQPPPTTTQPPPSTAAPNAAPAQQGALPRPRTPAEAMALPPGTKFIDPFGKERTR